MNSGVTGMAERLPVVDVVAEVGITGPRLHMMGVEFVSRTAGLAGVVVAGEHAVAERDVPRVRVVLLPQQRPTSTPVRIRASRCDRRTVADALHRLACLTSMLRRNHATLQGAGDVRLLGVGERTASRRFATSCRCDLLSRRWLLRGVADVLIDPLRTTRTAAETLVVALRDRATALFAHASHFYPNLTCF